MAATPISGLITAARYHLNEPTARFWADAELLDHARRGCTDLWGAIIDLNEEHYIVEDATNVSLAASATTLTGVPSNTFRVFLIEPRDVSSTGASRDITFVPRSFNHPYFVAMRSANSADITGKFNIAYALMNEGYPVAAPTVRVAPTVTAALNLRFVYIPGVVPSGFTTSTTNPVPGESDNALIAWMVAYARAKEREDRSPDPAWIAIYSTEKQSLLTRMAPRQTQEPKIVDGLFDYLGNY